MMGKCPLGRIITGASYRAQMELKTNNNAQCDCSKECQLWIRVYNGEADPYENCAFVIGALKNSEGMVPYDLHNR